jgi:RNA polymerase-associated protein RTF1
VSDDSEVEDEPESEEGSEVKYPLEGKYIDESDRER